MKDRYTAATVFDTVVTTALDGAPQRVIRTDVVDRIERSPRLLRFPRAALAALRFRKETGTSLRRPRSARAWPCAATRTSP